MTKWPIRSGPHGKLAEILLVSHVMACLWIRYILPEMIQVFYDMKCAYIYIYIFFFNHNSWRHATFALERNYCKSIRFPPKLFFGDISSFSGKFPMNVWISTAYYLSAFFPCNCYWRFLSFPYTVSSFFSIVVFQGGS